MQIDSIVQRRAKLAQMISNGIVDSNVLSELLVDGIPVSEEAVLWDYKRELPLLLDKESNKKDEHKFCEVMKDCVAFYNTFGGYLVVGVEDKTKRIVGFPGGFDAAQLNKKLQGATGVSIETVYRDIRHTIDGMPVNVGILYVPKRAPKANPAQFRKPASPNEYNRRAYEQNDFFYRRRDNCEKVVTPEEFEFLYGDRNIESTGARSSCLDNNLPPRDPDLVELRGREKELASLWGWLSDQFNPVHILCGLGGLGKTSIAYTFAERVIYNATTSFDRVIWLGAKVETFSGSKNTNVALSRTDFNSIETLLIQILAETGCPPEQIPENPSQDELSELVVEHLKAYRYLLVVDNADTLPDEDQHHVFHLLTQICSISRNKAIITARRNLGASRSVYTEVEGLTGSAFKLFVEDKCRLLGLKQPTEKEISSLSEVSGGSPLFTLSIIRLVWLGDTYRSAISNWRGSDGEKVREAAFNREISRLKTHEARVLLALSYLQSASLLELSSVLKLTRFEVQTALDGLNAFSMTNIDTSLPGGGVFKIPVSLSLVNDLLERRVSEWKAIKAECLRLGSLRDNQTFFVGQAITRSVALLRNSQPQQALDVAIQASADLPDSPDLQCLLGRCLVEVGKNGEAEEAFQKAFELGCLKRDLFDGWLSLAETSRDWRRVVEISDRAEQALGMCRYALTRIGGRMNVGDELARATLYSEASTSYAVALNDIRTALTRYTFPSDRAALWRVNETMASRWLGSVKMEAEQQSDGNRRVFGAVHKAALSYKYWNASSLYAGLAALQQWISRLSSRRSLSETNWEHLHIARERLRQLSELVPSKPSLDENFKASFAEQAKRILSQADLLLVR
ncbi:ATPase/tetratricopeptide repeat domain-containing protein (plasmid) [Rhizobium etli bv. mimosae str. IE4771]|uniref:ATPase/tetratricopeptide repeat domain-containing protein n=1 Tax=Rhizobium etli bv. mimosae str. IE4771 TaxID=1432050 RepID=A0A060I831_RHIET|nr:RNA-binding domain-containing protein [Rhizobium sp. IE4771]AIC30022.1 ATPase/tetratricopeptide repeat domain-containing protein [Rhizobium sp. IE4771]